MCNWFSSHWGRGYICFFVNPDDFEVKTCLFSWKSLGLQDANGMFSAIKTAFSEKDMWLVMANVEFLVSDEYKNSISVNTGLNNSLNSFKRRNVMREICLALFTKVRISPQWSEWLNPTPTGTDKLSKGLWELKNLQILLTKGCFYFENKRVKPQRAAGTRPTCQCRKSSRSVTDLCWPS